MPELPDFLRTLAGRLIIVAVVAASFFAVSRVVYDTLTYRLADAQMADLNEQMLRRSELAADYAIIALSELTAQGISDCSEKSLKAVRQVIYDRGAIKNILVLGSGGEVLCSGIPHSAELGILGINLYRGFPARNAAIAFHALHSDGAGLFGITWRFSNVIMMAVVNVDSILFDTLPAALRDSSDLSLGLGDDAPFARRSALANVRDGAGVTRFTDKSERFPLTARLSVPNALLAHSVRPFETGYNITAALLGLAFGALLARLAARPPDQRHRIRRAIANHEFKPFMQPIFSLADRRITGCEVLVRWVKPDGTVLPPSRFIDRAEDSGLIVPMTRAIMQMALVELRPLLAEDKRFTVAFNIVPADLMSPGFSGEIRALVSACSIPPAQVVLELTERQEFADAEIARHVIDALHDEGFGVALDDTGTGHNGLSYVQDLGVDIIKIDKKFIDLIASPEGNSHVVDMLVGLAHSLDMATLAEGIESEEQAMVLAERGVDKGQGYLVSPPLDPAAFRRFVAENRAGRVVDLDKRRERRGRV